MWKWELYAAWSWYVSLGWVTKNNCKMCINIFTQIALQFDVGVVFNDLQMCAQQISHCRSHCQISTSVVELGVQSCTASRTLEKSPGGTASLGISTWAWLSEGKRILKIRPQTQKDTHALEGDLRQCSTQICLHISQDTRKKLASLCSEKYSIIMGVRVSAKT